MKRYTFTPSILFIFSIILFSLSLTAISTAVACEIEVKIKGEQQVAYHSGDEIIVQVIVFLTHRNCPEGIQATKFKAVGMELKGATKWKEIETGRFVRLVKVKITDAEGGEGALHVRRTCDKEGGYGFLKISVPNSNMVASKE